MAPNLSGLMSGQKLSASNCPSTNCFRVNVSFANFLHSQYPPFANSSIGCKTKPFIYSETKSRLRERKEVTQGHEMRWLKSSVSSQKALQHMNRSLRNCCLNAAQLIGRSLICNTTPQCYTPAHQHGFTWWWGWLQGLLGIRQAYLKGRMGAKMDKHQSLPGNLVNPCRYIASLLCPTLHCTSFP